MEGTKVITSKMKILISISGKAAETVSSILTLAIGLVTNKTIPKGGVDNPITKFTQIIIPI
jgi:hypothetical protein